MEIIHWHTLTPEQRDRVIAEKVMGWQEKECEGEHGEVSGGWFCTKCGHDGNWGDDFAHTELPPHYTTSMDAAWLALEKMKEAKWSRFCIELDGVITQHKRGWDESTGNPYVTWFQKFVKLLNADGICVAVLRTMGYKVITEDNDRRAV